MVCNLFGTKPLSDQMLPYCLFNLWEQILQTLINTFRPRQNGCHFGDDDFKCIFVNENVRILTWISLKFVPKSPVNNIPALVQIMAWRRPGNKPLSEPMMASLLVHICVTPTQWVNEKLWGFLWCWPEQIVKSLNQQLSCQSFQFPWCSCDITIMLNSFLS